MRVLHIGAGNLYGGIERFLVSYARLRGAYPAAEPSFALSFPGRLLCELQACGSKVHLTGPVRMSRPWTLWRSRRAMAALLKRERPDVVVCHSVWPHAIFAPVVRAARLPLAFAAHDVPTGTHWLDRMARSVPPDLVLANSNYTRSTIPRLFPGANVQTHHGPIEAPAAGDGVVDRMAVRTRLRAGPRTPVIIMACRMERWKGHASLLSALAQLDRASPNLNWQCWIAGGPQRPREEIYLAELHKAVATYNLEDRVLFLGQRNDVQDLLAASDIHCQPNEQPEPFGVAFIEAMFHRLPIVTTAFGGGAEIVDERCGVLVPPGDALALAAVLENLIRDEDHRLALGAGGPVRARELCNPSTVIPRFYQSLEKLCNMHGTAKSGVRADVPQGAAALPFAPSNREIYL